MQYRHQECMQHTHQQSIAYYHTDVVSTIMCLCMYNAYCMHTNGYIYHTCLMYAYHHNTYMFIASAAAPSPFHAAVAAAGFNVALAPAVAVAAAGLNVALAPAAFISTAVLAGLLRRVALFGALAFCTIAHCRAA